FAPIAADSNAVVIDNTSAFRMNEDVPLVVPEINPEMIEKRAGGIIANPNCSTIQMVVALKPLHDFAKIKRIVVSTYQAVSGAGNSAINELSKQTEELFKFQDIEPSIFPHQIAFNILPHIDLFLDNHYTKEEMKMVNETRKIFNDYSIGVTATCVRVPVFIGHAESVNVEFHDPITPDQAKKLLQDASGVTVVDNPNLNQYPLPLKAADKDDVFVGRIRQDESVTNGLNLWIVADNLRKGAALNAVQIGEKLIEEFS
ncbi:MAG: aspartate-semialdehyde dehydrogenase, partial [Nitrospinota bacterium]